ncbi:MAG TPA: hypothetical protein VN256_08185 [Pyrinomonadaceae bacterium]|nr:hypothetical protein [Pyrinomonadaceae bacterium]
MSRKTISTIVMILGLVTAVTGAVAAPLAQFSTALSDAVMVLGAAAAVAARYLRHTPEVRRARRAVRKDRRAARKAGKTLTALALLGVTWASAGCGVKPPSRETLEKMASAGRTVENTIEANRGLPLMLFSTGRLTMQGRIELDEAIEEARSAVADFNEAMAGVLASEKPSLKPLVPLALKLVRRVETLNRPDLSPVWNAAFGAAEVSLLFVANYFAITVSELRTKGLSDRQIARAAGVPYDPADFELLEGYRARAARAQIDSE